MRKYPNTRTLENQFKFLDQVRGLIREDGLKLVYSGSISQRVVSVFAELAIDSIESIANKESVKRTVFHCLVELMQNVAKHGANEDSGAVDGTTRCLPTIMEREDQLWISTGNMIRVDQLNRMARIVSLVNNLDEPGLQEYYFDTLSAGSLSKQAGAGLGLIDIAKRTGHKLYFRFLTVNDIVSFMGVGARVDLQQHRQSASSPHPPGIVTGLDAK